MKSSMVVDLITAQAGELLKSEEVKQMLSNCTSDDERLMKLAISSVYALVKANS